MKTPISIIIPTYNNPQFFNPCLLSIIRTGVTGGLAKIIVVNNGNQPIKEQFHGLTNVEVLNPGKNLGWENGLKYGIEHTDSPFLVFQNDDTHIPKSSALFYNYLIRQFEDKDVAAVGPSTTNAAGWHSIYLQNPISYPTEVSYLIFFTVMVRRSHYEEAGGIDTSCPGGDDLDLSIRFRKMGKKLMIQPDAFLIHHGFKTGERVRGGPEVSGGWNSKEMTDKTNQWLIQKHGFKTFMDTLRGLPTNTFKSEDLEGSLIAGLIESENVLELGCGARKTVPQAVGMDMVPKGMEIPNVAGMFSVADITGDVSKPLPIQNTQDTIVARHILEHCIDTVETLHNWNNALKLGGRLIIAVPDETNIRTIPMNPEHVHGFTPGSLKRILEMCGFKESGTTDCKNGISFVSWFEKVKNIEELNSEKMEILHA